MRNRYVKGERWKSCQYASIGKQCVCVHPDTETVTDPAAAEQ